MDGVRGEGDLRWPTKKHSGTSSASAYVTGSRGPGAREYSAWLHLVARATAATVRACASKQTAQALDEKEGPQDQ